MLLRRCQSSDAHLAATFWINILPLWDLAPRGKNISSLDKEFKLSLQDVKIYDYLKKSIDKFRIFLPKIEILIFDLIKKL